MMGKETYNIFQLIAKNAIGFTYFGLCDKKNYFVTLSNSKRQVLLPQKWK
jgi:hypothetical protein